MSRALTLMGGDALKLQQRTAALLASLPRVDPRELHALGDSLGTSDRVALAAFITWRASRDAAAPPALARVAATGATASELRLLLLVAGLTGLSSFIYEVVWIRMLTLVFGARRIPEIGSSLGQGIREFKRSLKEVTDPDRPEPRVQPPVSSSSTIPTSGDPKRLNQ